MPEDNGRDSLGRWRPGTTGNAAGRPLSTTSSRALRAAINEHAGDIIDRLVTSALAGDTGAARILLERVCPPARPSELPEPIPLAGDTLTARGVSVLEGVRDGSIAVSQGAALLASLADLGKLIEATELAERMAAIEARLDAESGEHNRD